MNLPNELEIPVVLKLPVKYDVQYEDNEVKLCIMPDWENVDVITDHNEEIITWHPYPDEKPKKSGRYIVVRDDIVWLGYYDEKVKYFDYEQGRITAWAELPKPYKEEE